MLAVPGGLADAQEVAVKHTIAAAVPATLLLLSLFACKGETLKNFAGCEVEGTKIYPDHMAHYSQYREFLAACMASRGYESGGCSTDPRGYRPSGTIAKFFDDLERKLQSEH